MSQAKLNSNSIFPTIRLLSILFLVAQQNQEVSATASLYQCGANAFFFFFYVQGKITQSDSNRPPTSHFLWVTGPLGSAGDQVWEPTVALTLSNVVFSKDNMMTMRENLSQCHSVSYNPVISLRPRYRSASAGGSWGGRFGFSGGSRVE